MAKSKALDGVVVLDMTQVLAGPFAATLLSDFGADVIMVEPSMGGFYRQRRRPGQSLEDSRRRGWSMQRNRRSFAINLKTQKGKEIFLELVKKADVVVQNFSPGTMDKLGLGYDALSKANPGIIYCAMTGYGSTGPYRDKLAYDSIIQADSGIQSMTGFPDGPPVKVGPSIADYCGGVYAVVGILIALYNRTVTGKGQMIDAGMLDAMCHWTVNEIGFGEREVVERYGNRYPAAILDAHKTKDDEYVVLTTQTDEMWEILLKLIGKEEIIPEKWDPETRNITRRDEAEGWVSAWAKTKTLDEALKELKDARIPATAVTTRKQLATHPQVLAREILVEVNDPDVGKIGGIRGIAPKLLGTPGMIDMDKVPPELGQHTEEILATMLGYGKEQIAKFKEEQVI
jgi:CoA:oxalate CoA-transferase